MKLSSKATFTTHPYENCSHLSFRITLRPEPVSHCVLQEPRVKAPLNIRSKLAAQGIFPCPGARAGDHVRAISTPLTVQRLAYRDISQRLRGPV
jgi:hypothetical protein